jgi:hypothetical protein
MNTIQILRVKIIQVYLIGVVVNCLYCGKEIVKGRKYCNNSCQNNFQNKVDLNNKARLCKKCNEIKSFNEFSPRNKEGDLSSICKKCNAEKMSIYRRKNHKRHLEYRRNIRKENSEKYKEYDKKRRENPVRKISENISRSIRYHISKNGKSTFDILPYTIEELFNRLKKTLPEGITWENYLENTNSFHIDHIIPQSIYTFESIEDEEFLKCWNLRNLRIISKKENISKNGRLIPELIKENGIQDLLPKGVKIE